MDTDRFHPRHHQHLSERDLILLVWREIMVDFTNVNSALNKLSGDVSTLIAQAGSGSTAADQAAADGIAKSIADLSARVEAAITPATPPVAKPTP